MTQERISFSTKRFLVGKAGPFPRLVFSEDVMLRLDQFARARAKGEHGGFLIGRVRELKSAEQYEILVERFVPIPQKDDASRLVIAQEHILTVELALENSGAGEKIVGWAHTHPGFGVFLSNFDKEQHQRYFSQPWQVAYVFDNVANERAVYHCVQGEWQKLGGYYILREMVGQEQVNEEFSGKKWTSIILLLFLIISFVALGNYGYGFVRQLISTKEASKQEQETLVKLPEPVVSVERLIQETEPQSLAEVRETTQEQYGIYIVEKGDNLWKIAEKLWGDPSLFKLLADENGITNPSVIAVGKVLKVPPRSED